MSSFIIYFSHQNKPKDNIRFKGFSKAEFSNYSVFYKENKETLVYSFNSEQNFIISGLGINKKGNAGFISEKEWKRFIGNPDEFITELNGHFAGCIFHENKLICFNDILGLRDLYYFQTKDFSIISSSYSNFKELDVNLNISNDYLAGMWQTSIPPFYKTPFNEVKRLGPGGRLEIDYSGKLKHSNKSLKLNSANESEICNTLSVFTSLNHPAKKFSLGLSGGLDSRTLLSILLNVNPDSASHTFGSRELADVQIAKAIAGQENITLRNFDQYQFTIDNIVGLISNYIPFSGLTIPISDLIHIDYHKKLDDDNFGIIDGGFGEIGRRQFLNRFLLNGKKIIAEQNTKAFITNLRIAKADIFSEEYNSLLDEILLKNSEEVWNYMKDVPEDDVFTWLDIFATRFKLPNIYGYGQHTLDQIAVAYMPFAQQEFLSFLLPISTNLKNNGKLYRNIIKHNKPELEKINLVKDYVEYPFGLGTINSHIVRKLKRKFMNITKVDPIKYKMYENLKEYIGDEINSSNVRKNSFYDTNKIESLFNEYYSGNKNKLAELDWWLTFNEWYKIMFVK